jgi:hypothetical protein
MHMWRLYICKQNVSHVHMSPSRKVTLILGPHSRPCLTTPASPALNVGILLNLDQIDR